MISFKLIYLFVRLASIFRKEDFYAAHANNSLPSFDVMVTNPPYSGDNMEKLLDIACSVGKPFFLLLPNYVYRKVNLPYVIFFLVVAISFVCANNEVCNVSV